MKQCSKCKTDKPLPEFNRDARRKDGYASACKACHRIQNQKHYAENIEAYRVSTKKYKRGLKDWFAEYKSTLVCCRCGTDKPWRLDFHHIDPTTKIMSVSSMVANTALKELILEEIAKCIVVCRNCHADIHYEQYRDVVLW